MEEKITIIEGPPPTFEVENNQWVLGLYDSPVLSELSRTRLRTFNGPALVERCHKAWRESAPVFLEYRSYDGLYKKAPIVAARTFEQDEGHVLVLWVSLPNEDIELELGYDDDIGDEDDESDLPDLGL